MRAITGLVLVLLLLPGTASGEIAILRLQVTQGEGAIHVAGTRTTRPFSVLVTDETGGPIAGALVSFRLPEDGVSGTFANGMRTDVAVSDQDGIAVAPGIAWGMLTGPGSVRVLAAKDQARAGLLIAVFVAAGGGAQPAAGRQASARDMQVSRPAGRGWRWLMPVAAGGVAVLALGVTRPGSRPGASPSATATSVAAAPVSIGAPSIVIGKP